MEPERFSFGANWGHYLKHVSEDQIRSAEHSMKEFLGGDGLKNQRFLDIGCGSGLFSLAAQKLGAQSVYSMDYDWDSVACAQKLKDAFFKDSSRWMIEQGSILDAGYSDQLRKLDFDIIYSWGVLHHTGNLQQALQNLLSIASGKSKIIISIYNDQGWLSDFWRGVKFLYNQNRVLRYLIIFIFIPYFILGFVLRAARGQFRLERGMHFWNDYIDWLGGYPFEVAKPQEIIRFFETNGYTLSQSKLRGFKAGCNEFVFVPGKPPPIPGQG